MEPPVSEPSDIAQERYRAVHKGAGDVVGTVSGGPMYYIEQGLGPKWKWMAVFFATALGFTAFLTGNAIQANTVADTMGSAFGVAQWVTGAVTVMPCRSGHPGRP